MLDTDNSYVSEPIERIPSLTTQESRTQTTSLDVRRRIEHMREIKRLRELLDDPEFDELSE